MSTSSTPALLALGTTRRLSLLALVANTGVEYRPTFIIRRSVGADGRPVRKVELFNDELPSGRTLESTTAFMVAPETPR